MTTYYNAEFAAEYIVKRDPDGNWCEPSTDASGYASLIDGLNTGVYCIAEAPDGKIYAGGTFIDAGGTTDADKLARWNPTSEAWESVGIDQTGATITSINCLAFDANGDLYVGGAFVNLGSTDGSCIVKITDINGTPTINAMGIGVNSDVFTVSIDPNGNVYAGGGFSLAGGVADTNKIAMWDGTSWNALSTGLNNTVRALAFAPNGDLYVGGLFTDATCPYLCKWGVASDSFEVVGTNTDINALVYALAFDSRGNLYVGGNFTNAGGVAEADRIARWNGANWEALGTGTNGSVRKIVYNNEKFYVAGDFTTAGGLTLIDRVAIYKNGAWQPLDIDLPGSAAVYSILPASDGSLYIGGAFSTAAETPDENAVCGISYEIEVAEEIEEDFDTDDLDPVDGTGV